ncbi:MAG: HflX GTPase family protein, partial [Bacteroidota bacterium]
AQQRFTQRKGRSKHTRAALVGYTNAGKSTLLNLLSGSDVFVENRLFATLDPTTRLVPLGSSLPPRQTDVGLAGQPGVQMLMTDTVGFIRKLPPHLVASFKSTLEEITEADLLLHLVDISSKHFEEQIQVVQETLQELGAHEKPTLMVFNKIDRLPERSILSVISAQYPQSVFVSATRGINIAGLKQMVLTLLESEFVEEHFTVSQEHQKLISYLHTAGEVLDKTYEDSAVLLKLRLLKKDRDRIIQLVKGQQAKSSFEKESP